MSRNIQQPKPGLPITFNVQRRRELRAEHWAFVVLLFSALSLAAQTNSNMLPPLAPAYGVMRPTFWEQYGTEITIGAIVFLVIATGLVWIALLPASPAKALPPEAKARNALAKLSLEPETGAVLSEISQVLRHYVIEALGIPEGEWTTSEFAAALANNEKAELNMTLKISNFLRECDQRKFAPANAGASLGAAKRALEIVSEMEKQRAKPAVPA